MQLNRKFPLIFIMMPNALYNYSLQAKVRIEVLEKERARLLELNEKVTAEKLTKEREHHLATLDKFRAQGMYR